MLPLKVSGAQEKIHREVVCLRHALCVLSSVSPQWKGKKYRNSQ